MIYFIIKNNNSCFFTKELAFDTRHFPEFSLPGLSKMNKIKLKKVSTCQLLIKKDNDRESI